MSLTITKRPSYGGGAIFTSETATTIKEAIAEMRGANLQDDNLQYANLGDANLRGAYLQGAYLQYANLTLADLTEIKADVFRVLDAAPAEVEGLLLALREGRIDGSQYEGACACLVGTIANLRDCNYKSLPGLEPDSSSPSERWFLAIQRGSTPASSPVAAITEEWILEWLAQAQEVVA